MVVEVVVAAEPSPDATVKRDLRECAASAEGMVDLDVAVVDVDEDVVTAAAAPTAGEEESRGEDIHESREQQVATQVL